MTISHEGRETLSSLGLSEPRKLAGMIAASRADYESGRESSSFLIGLPEVRQLAGG